VVPWSTSVDNIKTNGIGCDLAECGDWCVVVEIATRQRLWYLGLLELIILKQMVLGCDLAECGDWCVVVEITTRQRLWYLGLLQLIILKQMVLDVI
jgi:hypothetical protein